jgi:lipoyl(octanoyl) transferase
MPWRFQLSISLNLNFQRFSIITAQIPPVVKQQSVALKQSVAFQDLGLIDYKECWDYQEKLFNEIISQKIVQRNVPENERQITKNHLIFCEHPHVYTLGKSGSEKNMLLDNNELQKKKATYYKINRGGDITYHGPGQIVGYPIFDLDNFFTDIHKYLRFLEEAIILTLKDYKIESGRISGLTGVWVDHENPVKARKIAAMGVRSSRWVTMHGFAFNINCDLSYFENIVPCGIIDKSVTSVEKELGSNINMEEVKARLKNYIARLFDIKYK